MVLRTTPVDTDTLRAWIDSARQHPLAPLAVVLVFFVGSLLTVPLTVFIVATSMAFGPWLGFLYSLVAELLTALVTFFGGALLGRRYVRRLAGSRLTRISERLARRGLLTITLLRLFPVAPFVVINAAAGASHIRLRDYMLGSTLGMIPGTLAFAVFADTLLDVLRRPTPQTWLMLIGVLLAIALGFLILLRWRRRQAEARAQNDGSGVVD